MDLRGFLTRAGVALMVRGVEILGKFALYAAVAVMAAPGDGGVFFFCASWAHLASTMARQGFDRALISHIAADCATGRGDRARRDVVLAAVRCLMGAVLLALLTAAVAAGPLVTIFHLEGLKPALLLTALVLVPQALLVTLCGALSGLGRAVASLTVQNAVWPLITLGLLLCGWRSALLLVAALGLGMLVALLLVCFALWRQRNQFRAGAVVTAVEEPLPPLARTARSLAVVEMVQVSLGTVPTLVLGLFADGVVVAGFSLAQRLSMLVWAVLISLGTLAAPRFSSLYRLGDRAALYRLNRLTQLAGAVTAGSAALFLAVVPGWLLGQFNPAYEVAASALQVMALGQVVNAVFAGQDVMLAMIGLGPVLRRINLLQSALNLLGCCLLVPFAGAAGAALCIAVPTAAGAVLMAMAVRVHLGREAVIGPGAAGPLMRFLKQGE